MQTLRAACLLSALALASTLGAQQSAPQASGSPANPTITRRVRVSGEVLAEQRLTYVEPVFPDLARLKRIEGTVVLHVLVGPDGTVEQAIPISGPGDFQQPAVDAVKQWTYKPFLINGEPVEVDTTVTVNFRL